MGIAFRESCKRYYLLILDRKRNSIKDRVMRSIQFTITSEEVEELAAGSLNATQTEQVLKMVECDEFLWKEIERSIRSAVREVLRKIDGS